jgi:hypothetical protein
MRVHSNYTAKNIKKKKKRIRLCKMFLKRLLAYKSMPYLSTYFIPGEIPFSPPYMDG